MSMEAFEALSREVSNWGRWGKDDELGTLNLITEEVRQRAAASVKSGKVFTLGLRFGPGGPQPGRPGGRFNPQHFVIAMGSPMGDPELGFCFSDDVVSMPLQCATQWDSLAHVHYADTLYNGYPMNEALSVRGAHKNGIENPARTGMLSRGILLDIARLHDVERLEPMHKITPEELEAACDREGVTPESGDILLVRTGHIQHFTREKNREAFMGQQPGLNMDCARWLHTHGIAAVCADNVAVEPIPAESGLPMPLHMLCLRDMGCTFGEMFDLCALAADCAEDGQWTFLFTAPPLAIANGLGSPINPVALK